MGVKLVLFVIVFCANLICAANVALGQTRPDFNGKWSLEATKSEGIPPGIEQTMTILQNDQRIDVETKTISRQGELTIKSSYILDGREAEAELPGPMPGITARGKQTARWAPGGFDSEDEGTFDTPYGPATIKTVRKWRLSENGKILTIELLRTGPVTMQSKRVFAKKG